LDLVVATDGRFDAGTDPLPAPPVRLALLLLLLLIALSSMSTILLLPKSLDREEVGVLDGGSGLVA